MNAAPHTIEPWVFHELGYANFGDARLTGRMIILANDLACHPEYSLAHRYDEDGASLKARDRLFDNPSVTPIAMLAPHQHKAWEHSGHGSWVLTCQDTSSFNYT
ncbi:MAG: transposase DNA-binding-containing protein, partial [Firmicutes bacterium]|nr:transposase DNA-binding-containing protein [Bacillota bacterium]